MNTNVLVIGGGGREHALAWKLSQSCRLGKLFVAPGNGGTCQIAQNVAINAGDIPSLVQFVRDNQIDLTVVGPDEPLAFGIVDAFKVCGLRIFGPTQAAAKIESSKVFAKKIMEEANIPTAKFQVFDSYCKALKYVRSRGAPIVVKASGLALGKGVYVCKTIEQAESALQEIMLKSVHKEAGKEVVIEEFLEGQEISIHAFCDGQTHVLLPPAQDHKPIYDGDEGKNTGGMGTIAPLPWVNASVLKEIDCQIVAPTLKKLAEQGREFSGLLYPGLKMTKSGPKVLEFNARFGDPETQSYMRLLKTDILDILEACVDGRLSQITIEWQTGFAVCIIIASQGYPDEYKKGYLIRGIEQANQVQGVVVFHAGTSLGLDLKTAGGRVLGVTAIGDTLRQALDRAYEAVHRIEFEGKQYRNDIGTKSLVTAF